MTTPDRTSARRTSSGVAFNRPARLRTAILTGGAAGPVVELRDDTDGSTAVIVTLRSPSNDSRSFPGLCLPFKIGIHIVVVSGNADITLEAD